MALRPISKKLRIVGGFELSLAKFIGNSFDVSGQDTVPKGVTFSPDGTRMFVIGQGSDSVLQYSLTTNFDIDTASFTGTSFDVSGQATTVTGVAFKPDGTRMFVTGKNPNPSSVFQYELSVGFDLSTASFSGTSFDVSAGASDPTDVTFSPDGTTMFVVGRSSAEVLQFSLPTAFDVSATTAQNNFNISGQTSTATGVAFNSDGTRMFVTGESTGSVFQYELSVGFDLSTASFSGTTFDTSGQATTPADVTFNPDGTGMFIIDDGTDSVFEHLVGRLTLQK